MASLGESIRAALIADTAVAALVGYRIFPNKRPQNAEPPFAVYSVISQTAEHSLDGRMETTLKHTRLQLDSYAKTYAEAHSLATAIENVIGNLSSPDISGIKVGERDLHDDPTSLHRVASDFLVSSG